MYMKRIINKVPGIVQAESKKEKQGYIGDLSSKTVSQLNELMGRQCKLLANKIFVSKLPDKGEKIMRLKVAIEDELKKRNERDDLSKMLSTLSLNGKEDLDAMEWTGRSVPRQFSVQEELNDSDDEIDPFKILATHSGAGFHKKRHKELKPEPSLIQPSDLEVGACAKEPIGEDLEEYAKHLCERFDATSAQANSKFLPHRTLKVVCTEKKGSKKQGKHWEVTAATPPPPVLGDTKLLSLQESIVLQMDHEAKLKEVQTKHAMERLAAWHGRGMGKPPQNVGSYREQASCSSSDEEGSEHEVHDEEYPDGGGVVVYNLIDDTND